MAIGNTAAPDPTRALVKFAVATVLPTGARITSASLELTVVRASGLVEPATFELHRLLADWGEGDKGAGSITGAGGPADPGEATWNARFHPDQLWTAAGGGDGTDYASAPSATARLESSEPLIFGPSDAMKTDVQAWLDDPSTNFGWLLKDETESNATTARDRKSVV